MWVIFLNRDAHWMHLCGKIKTKPLVDRNCLRAKKKSFHRGEKLGRRMRHTAWVPEILCVLIRSSRPVFKRFEKKDLGVGNKTGWKGFSRCMLYQKRLRSRIFILYIHHKQTTISALLPFSQLSRTVKVELNFLPEKLPCTAWLLLESCWIYTTWFKWPNWNFSVNKWINKIKSFHQSGPDWNCI